MGIQGVMIAKFLFTKFKSFYVALDNALSLVFVQRFKIMRRWFQCGLMPVLFREHANTI